VSALGAYEFNYTCANSYTLGLPSWVSSFEVIEAIRALSPSGAGMPEWGDVFASRRQS
jgi:hypothetical protein